MGVVGSHRLNLVFGIFGGLRLRLLWILLHRGITGIGWLGGEQVVSFLSWDTPDESL